MSLRVLVLGCGPAGLIAAYAAQREFGAKVKILSVKRPSQLFGCQYLHEPIPGISDEDQWHDMTYTLEGDAEDYRRKVYGSLTPPVSPQHLAGNHRAWDLRVAYARLWEMFEPSITDLRLTPEMIVPMLSDIMPDVVISSLPAPVLCQVGEQHTFTSVKCWAIGDAPELGQSVHITCQPFHVVCNGLPDTGWYRLSNCFGYGTVEWPGHRKRPPLEGVVEFSKPLITNCDCMPSILRVGRYGMWRKGVLSHEAYAATARRIGAMA
jgi:hypothetical protein